MARKTLYNLYATGRTDPTYKNIWAFRDEAQRYAFLTSKNTLSFSNNKYWRVGATIKIPVSYENSFEFDYAEIINDFGTSDQKRWFAFVTARAYISNNVTLLTLDTDYVQTFYFSANNQPFYRVEGFIHRSTAVGAEFMPPRGAANDFPVYSPKCINAYEITPESGIDYDVIIYSSVDLTNLTASNYTYRTAIIDGVVTAAPPYLVSGTNSSDLLSRVAGIIETLNSAGLTEAIAGMYLAPAAFFSGYPESGISLALTEETHDIIIPQPITIDGYAPRHNILLGYDYTYFVMYNNQGEMQEYHYEDFSGTPAFRVTCCLSSGSPCVIAYPINYIGDVPAEHIVHASKITQAPSCSYLNDTYKIWLAQTQNSREAAIQSSNMAIQQAKYARDNSLAYQLAGVGSATLINAGNAIKDFMNLPSDAMMFSAPQNLKNSFSGGSGRTFGLDYSAASSNISDSISSAALNIQANLRSGTRAGEMAGMAQLFLAREMGIDEAMQKDFAVKNAQQAQNQLFASYRDKQRIPATASGSNAYGNITHYAQYGFLWCVYSPDAENAARIDDQLDASGQTNDQYGAADRYHTVYDYFEIASARVLADPQTRPQFVRNMMIDILLRGVYLWFYNNGDISPYIGLPYKLNNPEYFGG